MTVENLRQSPMMDHMLEALDRGEEIGHHSPPRREKILGWQKEQDSKICPNPDDPDACNVYQELTFPDEVYEDIQEYREEQVADS